jgi:putative cell wall-binding protein
MTSFYSWFYTDIDMSKLENKHDIWLAHYTSYTNYGGQFNMWQFASTRKVPGVASPNTDQDVRYVEVKKPTGNITLNYAIDGDYLYLAWNKISNAQGYSVYRKDGSGKVTKIGSTSQAVTALAMRDDTCQYYIQAYNTCGGQTYYSSNSNVVTISKPKISDGAKKVVLAGMNEFTTATAVSKQAFPNGSYSVVLASNTSFADALAAVPLADGLSAPILLTGPQSLQQDTMNEIKRLKAHSIFIMGGTLVVSQAMEDELKRQGYDVFRIGGATRFATAALVAENTDYVRKNNGKSQAKEIFFVSGENFADALSLGNIAARRNANILYMTKSAQFDDKTQQYLEKMKGKLTNIYIVGGPLAISEDAEKVLAPYAPKITRIGGVNRFETSVKLNETFASDLTGDALCTTTGLNFPDALAGGVLAASLKAPVVIADNGYTSWLESYSKKRKPKTIYVFGGITKDII